MLRYQKITFNFSKRHFVYSLFTQTASKKKKDKRRSESWAPGTDLPVLVRYKQRTEYPLGSRFRFRVFMIRGRQKLSEIHTYMNQENGRPMGESHMLIKVVKKL